MLSTQLEAERMAQTSVQLSDTWLIFVSKLLDGAVISCGLVAARLLHGPEWDVKYTLAILLASIIFFLLAEAAGLYRPWRGESVSRQFFQILIVWGETILVLLLIAYALKTSSYYSRIATVAWMVAAPLLMSGWRIVAVAIFWRMVRREGFKRKAVVWGSGEHADKIAEAIRTSPWLGLTLVDHVRDDFAEISQTTAASDLGPTPAQIDALEHQARRGDFDILYIALPTTARERITNLIERLSDTTLSVYMVPDYFTTSLFHGKWSNLEGMPIISVFDTPFWGVGGWIKRGQDAILSFAILLIVAVPMALIALAVKLSSPGPVLFKQRRYGADGKEINVWKFRTMRVCEDGAQVDQARRNDPRVTKLGAFLRRTSLDELPQFINVLKGDMSIVGPRPHAVAHNEIYRKRVAGYMLRHQVKPGITGWAQINGWRGETDTLGKMEKRVEHDLWYIRNWSLWLDIKIILMTLVYGFSGKNAY